MARYAFRFTPDTGTSQVTVFQFTPLGFPYPLWHGPYAVVPGRSNGMRVRRGAIEAQLWRNGYCETWVIDDSPGARSLVALVQASYGGGRLLLLPNGAVIKPVPRSSEGERRLLGHWWGSLTLVSPFGQRICTTEANVLAHARSDSPRSIRPGDPWPGPATTGLRCRLDPSGSLFARTWQASQWGRTEVEYPIAAANSLLSMCYRLAGGHGSGGSVRLLEGGHVVMPYHDTDGGMARYVGYVLPSSLPSISDWKNG